MIFGCAGSSLLCRLSLVAVLRLLIAVASLQALGCEGFSSCGSWAPEHRLNSCDAAASLLCGMWDLAGSGTEPIGRQILYHWATREAHQTLFYLHMYCLPPLWDSKTIFPSFSLFFLGFFFFFSDVDHFYSLYWICYNTVSVLRLSILSLRPVES